MSGEPKEFQNLLSLKDPRGSQAGYWGSSRRNSWEGDENRSDGGEESSSELGCKLRAILQPSTGSFGSSPSVVRVEKYSASGNKRSASGAGEEGLLATSASGVGGDGAAGRGSCCARLKASMDAFTDPEIESLFQQYYLKQKRADFQVLVTCGIVFLAHLLLLTLPAYSELLTPGFLGVISFLILLLIAGECFCWRLPADSTPWKVIPFVGVAVVTGELVVAAGLLPSPTTPLTWTVLATFFFVIAVPLSPWALLPLAILPGVVFLTFFGLRNEDPYAYCQAAGIILLLLGTGLLGFGAEIWQKARQRRSFKETRKAFEVKCIIDEQSKKQERLLLSVLPQHVATAMRRDMESGPKDSQFKKIYMSRHENVSILFADIVGFTAISSTYSASELVQILNELFARFDRLAEKYHQLRIKILGDCYYCISGAPEERADHAILSVHMGLSMVEAIKYVRETTGSPVDMRVGIHTGAVLAGVLGQRQWHYDVYSKDVILANQMESSGMPGRVHISNVTYDCLNGAFEVEKAGGEKREEALRQAGLTTYFILKVLKPLKPEGAEETNGDISQLLDPEVSDNNVLSRENSVNEATNQTDPPADTKASQAKARRKRLLADLVNREGQRDALKDYVPKIMGLGFRRSSFEEQFNRRRLEPEPALVLSALAPFAAYLVASLALMIATPRGWPSFLVYLSGIILFAVFSLLPLSEVERKIPVCFYRIWSYLRHHSFLKAIFFVFTLLCVTALSIGDIFLSCYSSSSDFNSTSYENCSWSSLGTAATMLPTLTDYPPTSGHNHEDTCTHPGFLSNAGILILIGITAVTDLSYLIKAALILIYVGSGALINILVIFHNFGNCRPDDLGLQFDSENPRSNNVPWEFKEQIQTSMALVEAGFMLAILARQWEKTGRVLFVWALGLTVQRERASAIRRHNQVLVYNILPPHVASHFMQRRPIRHSQLYSQSYSRVGVLFASMPNFSDFYSEESVNNQGLECLRFLNEVISDFDALLENPAYREISKIKTIGSTYMAASGLAPAPQRHRTKSGASPIPPAELDRLDKGKKSRREKIREKWWHLSLLVEFAFKMREALKAINEQSFNNFILKMGINHGPITAGVIGARKPHYDIWGNTVNVASRMESTGRAGFIQVTEETKQILSHFGYVFETRGLVSVKGKGQLMTYYLIGKGDPPTDDEDGAAGDDGGDTNDDDDDNTTAGPISPTTGGAVEDSKDDEDVEDIPDD